MPVSVADIRLNLDRVATTAVPQKLKNLAVDVVEQHTHGSIVDYQRVWEDFVLKADELKLADRIPGSVGRRYAVAYGSHKRPTRRGKSVRVELSMAANSAVEKHLRGVDAATLEDGVLVFSNRAQMTRAVEAMLKRSNQDLVTPLDEAARDRRALAVLWKQVGGGG